MSQADRAVNLGGQVLSTYSTDVRSTSVLYVSVRMLCCIRIVRSRTIRMYDPALLPSVSC